MWLFSHIMDETNFYARLPKGLFGLLSSNPMSLLFLQLPEYGPNPDGPCISTFLKKYVYAGNLEIMSVCRYVGLSVARLQPTSAYVEA